MSDFEQWWSDNNDGYDPDSPAWAQQYRLQKYSWNAAIASMQGEATQDCSMCPNNRDVVCAYCENTGIVESVDGFKGKCPQGCERLIEATVFNTMNDLLFGRYVSYITTSEKLSIGDKLFTYPPSAASKIAEQDARIKELEQQLEVARKDAERWQAICNLWFSCSELKLIQKEDGGYSICEMEFVDNLLVSDFCGDTPEHTIDAAIRQIGGAE